MCVTTQKKKGEEGKEGEEKERKKGSKRRKGRGKKIRWRREVGNGLNIELFYHCQ